METKALMEKLNKAKTKSEKDVIMISLRNMTRYVSFAALPGSRVHRRRLRINRFFSCVLALFLSQVDGRVNETDITYRFEAGASGGCHFKITMA
jgi:hypothetical protein